MKYKVIYADPPWRYGFSKSKSREIENQYPTMDIKEICALKVPSADDCVLYLWATAPKMREAFQVMDAWGFEYKTQAIWDKEKMGMGYWFRGQHEILMVGTRGHVSPPAQSTRKSSVFRFQRSKHSKKPTEIRDAIALWFPDCSRLEMFARESSPGWDRWGNQVESNVALATPVPTADKTDESKEAP